MPGNVKTYAEGGSATYSIFTRFLGALAVIQLLAILWYVLFRFDGQLVVRNQNPALADEATAASILGTSKDKDEEVASFDEVVETPVPAPPLSNPVSQPANVAQPFKAPDPLGGAAQAAGEGDGPSPHRIDSPDASLLVDEGLRLREQGDTQGTLAKLREADKLEPNHPKILAEIATTYGQMGLDKKGAEYWSAVHEMGVEGAGAYWDLADMALRGNQIMEGSPLSGTYLRIARHVAVEDKDFSEGQRVVLRVHLKAEGEPDTELRGEDMFMQVLFYDLVNGATFERSIADAIPQRLSAPYDWKDGAEEIIEVEYRLPKLTDEQRAAFGRRSYFGYVIELYYKDVLQDVVANPRKLARK